MWEVNTVKTLTFEKGEGCIPPRPAPMMVPPLRPPQIHDNERTSLAGFSRQWSAESIPHVMVPGERLARRPTALRIYGQRLYTLRILATFQRLRLII